MILPFLLLLATPLDPKADPIWAKALKIHSKALVVDTHSDTTSRMVDEGFDVGPRATDGHMDLPRMKQGGLDAEFFAVYVSRDYAAGGGSARRALDMIDSVYRMAERHPDRIRLARTADDVRRIAKRKRIAALMGIEGGHAIEDSLGALRMFHNLGIRYMTLTHTNTNNWCDSSGDEPRWHGLNDLGRRVVREMNRIGMIVDVSHVSDEAFYAILETTTAPPIASHSSCRALCDHPRNMTDEMIKALAARRGVIQINFNAGFVDEDYRVARKEAQERLKAEARERLENDPDSLAAELKRIDALPPDIPPPPLAKLIDHIDHAVKVGGVGHVGLGSDFDGVPSVPQGIEDCSKLPVITYELLKRGYSETDIKKILGGNTLRVLEAVERESKRLRAAH